MCVLFMLFMLSAMGVLCNGWSVCAVSLECRVCCALVCVVCAVCDVCDVRVMCVCCA